MITKVDHTGILTDDLDRSIQFYTELLGMKVVERAHLNETVEIAFLAFPGQEDVKVELIRRELAGMQQESLVNHLAFTVQDIDAVIDKLKQNGVTISDGPKTILDGRKIAFFYGPCGEKLQLCQPAQA